MVPVISADPIEAGPRYRTPLGEAWAADARPVIGAIPEGTLDLAVTSPPFALLRPKAYGNLAEDEWVDWLLDIAALLLPRLRDTGSLVLDLGGAYRRGLPERSIAQWRFLVRAVDELGYHLAQDCYWHNPSKLPTPLEWVNKRKIRLKDPVNTVWWLSRTPWPKSDITRVRVPYSDRMRKLLADPAGFYRPGRRPSEHQVSGRFGDDNGGALPSHLLTIANSESNSLYLRAARAASVPAHPARFPAGLPSFFIRLLTDPGDLVLDPFAGSNTTGAVAESLGRRWLAGDLDPAYVAASAFRFLDDPSHAAPVHAAITAGRTVTFAPSA